MISVPGARTTLRWPRNRASQTGAIPSGTQRSAYSGSSGCVEFLCASNQSVKSGDDDLTAAAIAHRRSSARCGRPCAAPRRGARASRGCEHTVQRIA